MKVQDLFEIKSSVPYTWTVQSNNEYEAEFMVENGFYRTNFILISNRKQPFWVVEFKMVNGKTVDEYGNRGYGDEDVGYSPTVFGMVLDLVTQWVNKVDPQYVKFEAKTPKRSKLYSNIIRRIKKPNWKVHVKKIGNATEFEIRVINPRKKIFGFI